MCPSPGSSSTRRCSWRSARAIGLSTDMQALAMLCFALSPLTQLLHSVGMLDHHYVEHTFVLLSVWLGLGGSSNLESRRPRRSRSGRRLGLAPGFHNGLFILQLLPLGALFILWLRNAALPQRASSAFAIALLVATQLVAAAVGALPARHVRVRPACPGSTSTSPHARPRRSLLLAMRAARAANWRCSARCAPRFDRTARAAGVGRRRIPDGHRFRSSAKSPKLRARTRCSRGRLGPVATASYYSWLLFARAVAGCVLCLSRLPRDRSRSACISPLPRRSDWCCCSTQFRLHYFGWFALVIGPLLARRRAPGTVSLAPRPHVRRDASPRSALAFQPALRERLFVSTRRAALPTMRVCYPST